MPLEVLLSEEKRIKKAIEYYYAEISTKQAAKKANISAEDIEVPQLTADDADDDVPHQPRVRLLNVRFDVKALHPPQYAAADFVRRRHGVRTLRNRDNIVAARREKARHGFLHRSADRQRRLIAIVRWICHAQHRGHVDVDMPDAVEAVLHLLAFRFQRRFVGHMAPRAAAAAGVCRAIRRFPSG